MSVQKVNMTVRYAAPTVTPVMKLHLKHLGCCQKQQSHHPLSSENSLLELAPMKPDGQPIDMIQLKCLLGLGLFAGFGSPASAEHVAV